MLGRSTIKDPLTPMLALQEPRYLEFFAGVGNVFAETRSAGVPGVALDIEYGEAFGFDSKSNPFNFMTPSGFAFWP